MRNLLFVLIGISMVSTSAFAFEGPEVAWSHARVIISKNLQGRMDDPKIQDYLSKITTPRPVYVFFHGSEASYNPTNLAWLTDYGFIFVAEDSYARGGKLNNSALNGVSRRVEEVKYIAEFAPKVPWIDSTKIVFHGQSEGAWAVGGTNVKGPRAEIISGMNCQSRSQYIKVAEGIPLLSMQDPGDPVYTGTGRGFGTCASEMKGRPGSYVVELPGLGHHSSETPEGHAAILKFLREQGIVNKSDE